MLSLCEVNIGKLVRVKGINLDNDVKRRILDIGIIPESIIIKVLNSPFKKISAYDIDGSLISIRDRDALNIEVEYV